MGEEWTGLNEAEGQSPGRVVAGRYRLEGVLGRGGMGVVWRAVDTLIERTVAIKELRAPTGSVQGDRSSFVERALREARNAGRLNHPAVVAVHDVIAPTGDDDAVYIVMEYVQAPTLAEILDQQGPLPAGRVAAMGLGILDALDAAHAMGIVHRDIKPGNVLVSDGDRVKLTDFGIALAAEDTRLTRSGVIGTHAYLAPECFDAAQAGPAADLWALGATLFHAVAGRAPFDRDTTTASLRAILFEEPPTPPCEPGLARVITGLLTRPVDQRLTSDAARQQLQPIAAQPTTTRPTDPSPTPGQAPWEAQATALHRQPNPAPPPPPQPAPTHPAGPPPAPPPGPMSGGQWAGPPPQRNRAPLIVGGVLAAAVVLLVVIFAAASGGGGDDDTSTGGDGGSAGPRTAVEKFLKARQDGETALDAYLCRDDVSNGFDLPKLYHGDFLPNLMIVSYTIKSVEKDGDRTYVNASVRTSDDTHEVDGKVPVAREGGAWKVCFSRGIGETTTDVTSSSSTPSTTGPPPTVSGEACDTTGQSDPSIVADHYAVPNGGSADRAQACVYQGSVPVSVTKQVVVQYLIYDHGVGGGPFVYKDEKDGSTVTVTVTRESDGKFWVTDVSMS